MSKKEAAEAFWRPPPAVVVHGWKLMRQLLNRETSNTKRQKEVCVGVEGEKGERNILMSEQQAQDYASLLCA